MNNTLFGHAINYRKLALCLLLIAVVGFIVTTPALALKDAGEVGENVARQFGGAAQAVKMFAFFSGFCLVVASIVMFAGLKKPGNQTSPIVPVLMLVCGVVLVSIMTFIQIGSTSVLGSDQSSSAMSELGL